MPYARRLLSCLFAVFLLLSMCSNTVTAQLSSVQFNQAVDAAMSNLVAESAFQDYIFSAISFSVPTCASPSTFPALNPIPSNVTTIKLCYDGASYISEPWPSIYKAVGNGIVKHLNNQYKLALTSSFVLINTENGYFTSMKKAVDTGACAIAVADTTITSERSTQVNFAKCAYGSTANGFLRNELDNSTISISTFSDLNKPNVKVSFYQGTIFENIANQSLPLAQKIPSTYDGQFDLLTKNQVHAILGDGIDLFQFKSNNLKSCSSCYVKIFGDSAPFGVFTPITKRMSGCENNFNFRYFSFVIGILILSTFLMNF